jgi:hypothetical protein
MQTMKRTLSFLILFSSLLTGIVSCKKEHNNGQDTPAPAASIIQEYKNGDEFVRFEYNPDGSVKKATVSSELNTNGNIVDYNISYNAAKKISAIQTSAGEQIVPVYENGKLIRSDIFEGTERTGYTTYSFENDLLKRTTLYWGSGTDFEPFFELLFEHDNAGNTIKTIAMIATEQIGHLERLGHVETKYDSKTNPLYAQKELMTLLLQSASKNNVIQEDQFDANLLLEDRYIYTYTYKANGLPNHGEVKIGLPGQPPTISAVDFIYK